MLVYIEEASQDEKYVRKGSSYVLKKDKDKENAQTFKKEGNKYIPIEKDEAGTKKKTAAKTATKPATKKPPTEKETPEDQADQKAQQEPAPQEATPEKEKKEVEPVSDDLVTQAKTVIEMADKKLTKLLEPYVGHEKPKKGEPTIEQLKKRVVSGIQAAMNGQNMGSKTAVAIESVLSLNQKTNKWELAGTPLPEEINTRLTETVSPNMNINLPFAKVTTEAKLLVAEYDALSPKEQKSKANEYKKRFDKLGIPTTLDAKKGSLNTPNSGEVDEFYLVKALQEGTLPPAQLEEIKKIAKVVVYTDEYKEYRQNALDENFESIKAAAEKKGDNKLLKAIGDGFSDMNDMAEKLALAGLSQNQVKARIKKVNEVLDKFDGERESIQDAEPMDASKLEIVQTGSMQVSVMDFETGEKVAGSSGSSPYKADITLRDPETGVEYRVSVKSLMGGKPTFSAFYPDNMDRFISSMGLSGQKEWQKFTEYYRGYQELLGDGDEVKALKAKGQEGKAREVKFEREKKREGAQAKLFGWLHSNNPPPSEAKVEFMAKMLCCVVQSGSLAESAATHMAVIYPSGGLKVMSVRDYARHLLETPGSFSIEYSGKQGGNWRESIMSRQLFQTEEEHIDGELLLEQKEEDAEDLPSWVINGMDGSKVDPPDSMVASANMSHLTDPSIPDDDEETPEEETKPEEEKGEPVGRESKYNWDKKSVKVTPPEGSEEPAPKEEEQPEAKEETPKEEPETKEEPAEETPKEGEEAEAPKEGEQEQGVPDEIRQKFKDKENTVYSNKSGTVFYKDGDQWMQEKDGEASKVTDGDLINDLEKAVKK
jgi:hypothetical protein